MEKRLLSTERWPSLPISSERLILRPLEMKDAPDIAGSITTPEMVQYTLMIPFPYNMDDALRFIVGSKRSFHEGTALNLALIPRDRNRLCGVIGLMGLEPMHRKAKVGYWLNRSLWGQGYAAEALGTLSDYSFRTLRLHRLEAHIFEPNHRSRRVLEKARFRYEGKLRDHYLKDGSFFDALSYSLLSTDLEGL